MWRCPILIALTLSLATALVSSSPADAQTASPIAGVWSLNRSLSDFPREIGFNIDLGSAVEDDGSSGARGRRPGAGRGGAPSAARRETYDDGQRMRLITGEAR